MSLPATGAALALILPATPPPLDERAVVALIMVDRFADGADNAVDVEPEHPRRFQGGDLSGLRRRLPWLKALGVSHLWLTPLHTQIPSLVGDGDTATAGFHGYWPADFTSVDPHFGTVADLQDLARDADAAGMGLILDLVTNHTGYGAPDPRKLVRARCGDDETTACLFGLPDLQTEDPRVRAAVVDDVRWWLRQVPVAGVRLDAFKHLDTETARAITTAVHDDAPAARVIAERWGATTGDDVVARDIATGAADAAFDFGLMGVARDFVQGRMRSAAAAHHLQRRADALRAGPPMLTFLDNHDTETWAHAVGPRAPLGAPLLLLSPGIPVITWGTELGRRGAAADPENRERLDWAQATIQADDVDSPLHLWRRLVALRRESPAAATGTFTMLGAAPTGARQWLVFERVADADLDRVVVLVALEAPLRHCEPRGRWDVVETVAWPPARDVVTVTGDHRCLQVPANGTLVVRHRATLVP